MGAMEYVDAEVDDADAQVVEVIARPCDVGRRPFEGVSIELSALRPSR